STTEEDLRVEFSKHGTVVATQIIKDRDTGRSRGFGFVEMSDGADAAVAALNGAMFQGRTLTVNEARPRVERRGGGRGGGVGGAADAAATAVAVVVAAATAVAEVAAGAARATEVIQPISFDTSEGPAVHDSAGPSLFRSQTPDADS